LDSDPARLALRIPAAQTVDSTWGLSCHYFRGTLSLGGPSFEKLDRGRSGVRMLVQGFGLGVSSRWGLDLIVAGGICCLAFRP
jgi:hypothetical protein